MASRPTAACREHNDAAALDATCTHDIEEWAVVDESRMQRTDGAQVSLNDAIVAPSQSLRRFIEVVPCSNGRHFANEVAMTSPVQTWCSSTVAARRRVPGAAGRGTSQIHV